ncbi:uncharacterized protein LOC119287851 isoform X2 [Triticum dicoccoides]|uniref:uncharacterized protein LOC119287851 isoform X2 n=1 Tax=Triticum dicoccoides TaxID=85692 RepID=UPI00188ED59F|nr:uncharacterized protein LOC119287851 isoform X2 [Triticum dicoccoides]XP_037423381.1 uncharacterized protein LOC119287851 isoform X2 [Triticum dicoccoides]XP_044365987.1 uncharacterized protein LOC123087936 isoform X2 [Triticum aestivum]
MCDEHVGDTAQPPSAQAVQELVDSFSDQQLDATEIQKSMHGGIQKQAKNDTVFTPKQAGLGRSYREMLTDEEEDVVSYRPFWEYTWGDKCGSFEDYTFLTPTLYTYGTIPAHAGPFGFLQIFSIKVMENEMWRIRWPVEVYGFIAARDNLDRNRNLLFSQTRDEPQILTQQIRENLLSWLNRCLRENRKTKAMKRIHERSSQREVEKMWCFCRRRWASNIRQWTTGSCRGWWLQFPREWGGGGTRGGDGSKWIRTAEVHNHSEKATTAEERDR